MDGWFKFHRILFDKPIWITSTPEQKTILITIMGMVNFKENEWEFKGEKFIVKPGQCITSLESIAEKSGKGITIQNVRTALKRFEKYGFLTNESTNKNRLITVVNWGFYQGEEEEPNKQTNMQLTSNQQAANKQLTTNKESNKVKKVKNEKKKTQYAEFVSLTDDEYKKLVDEHSEPKAKEMIRVLDNYKGSKGTTYKSDYRAILNWVVERVNGQKGKGNDNGANRQNRAERLAIENELPF
jgi:rRNA-processing protein FCF1